VTDFPFSAGIDETTTLGGSWGLAAVVTDPAILETGSIGGGLLAAVGMSGGVLETTSLGGSPKATPGIAGGILETVTLGGSWGITAVVTNRGINPRAILGGTLTGTAATAAEVIENQGLSGRRFVPLLTRMREVVSESMASALNPLEAFLVSDNQILEAAMVASGAGPSYVGFVVSKTPLRLAFRPPRADEVIWSVPDGALMRYQNVFDSARQVWQRGWYVYRSLPQRFLDNTKVFDIFDPDGIYNYYASLVGGAMARMYVDNVDLLGFRDPDKVPLEWIPEAAAQVGATYVPGDSEAAKRAKLELAVPAAKVRSTSEAVTLILQGLGYGGYADEGWAKILWASVDIRSSTIGVDVTLVTSDDQTLIVSSTPGDLNNKATAFAYFYRDTNPTQPTLVPPAVAPVTLTMTVGATTKVFEFTNAAVITPGAIAVALGAVASDTMSNLLTEMTAQFGAALDPVYTVVGVSGLPFSLEGGLQNVAPAYIDRPHAYDYRTPDRYWASQRIIVHVTRRDGTTLSGGEINSAFKERLRAEINPILAASAKILWFATDREVGSEGVAVGETFTIT
jgi:hypothetical protein